MCAGEPGKCNMRETWVTLMQRDNIHILILEKMEEENDAERQTYKLILYFDVSFHCGRFKKNLKKKLFSPLHR